MRSVEDFNHSLTPSERRLISRLTTPFKIQAFRDKISYSGASRAADAHIRQRTDHHAKARAHHDR